MVWSGGIHFWVGDTSRAVLEAHDSVLADTLFTETKWAKKKQQFGGNYFSQVESLPCNVTITKGLLK